MYGWNKLQTKTNYVNEFVEYNANVNIKYTQETHKFLIW